MDGTHDVEIFVNRRELRAPTRVLTGREILALAGIGEDHDLFRLTGEGDRTGGTPVGLDEEVHLHEDDQFRAIPGNRNFG
jgi:hypothetical protein